MLLRVLQDKEFYRVGSKKSQRANVRVVAPTKVDTVWESLSGRVDCLSSLLNHFSGRRPFQSL
jgi:DNA-binding NtrC family response regulator